VKNETAPGGYFHYALEISYDGGCFNGWQSQPDKSSVQDALEKSLSEIGERPKADGAGRTDAGVHARAQVASVTLIKNWKPERLALALNSKLPPAVSVMRAAFVPEGFHARRHAISREYRYFIWNSSTCYPQIKPYVLWKPGVRFDWERASDAARLFEGTHDFRAFSRKVDCPRSAVRTVMVSRLQKRGKLITFRVKANAFLTNMVRIMIGNLLEIASGRFDRNYLASLLDSDRDRTASAGTASPNGLFLWRVKYSQTINWS
jgi:tRNA pseudouridine38-40 synthase